MSGPSSAPPGRVDRAHEVQVRGPGGIIAQPHSSTARQSGPFSQERASRPRACDVIDRPLVVASSATSSSCQPKRRRNRRTLWRCAGATSAHDTVVRRSAPPRAGFRAPASSAASSLIRRRSLVRVQDRPSQAGCTGLIRPGPATTRSLAELRRRIRLAVNRQESTPYCYPPGFDACARQPLWLRHSPRRRWNLRRVSVVLGGRLRGTIP